uniref:Uncharacterized protein n=1 Tax=Cacopsylla melanoneura TaxID=428564 RepID=A0A8D8V4S0_9HEMI
MQSHEKYIYKHLKLKMISFSSDTFWQACFVLVITGSNTQTHTVQSILQSVNGKSVKDLVVLNKLMLVTMAIPELIGTTKQLTLLNFSSRPGLQPQTPNS